MVGLTLESLFKQSENHLKFLKATDQERDQYLKEGLLENVLELHSFTPKSKFSDSKSGKTDNAKESVETTPKKQIFTSFLTKLTQQCPFRLGFGYKLEPGRV